MNRGVIVDVWCVFGVTLWALDKIPVVNRRLRAKLPKYQCCSYDLLLTSNSTMYQSIPHFSSSSQFQVFFSFFQGTHSLSFELEMDHQQQFCLKWNSFGSNLATAFGNLFKSESLADVTLFCEGKFHHIILKGGFLGNEEGGSHLIEPSLPDVGGLLWCWWRG